ncbi:hypothetical protein [Paludibacter jiangxiensis]|uniref:Uncharacterized protein n=1 Tax=Paludibacter jiangxiensis TaxID=681398 RepID=A0A170ZCW2_9BACT|nr:hypothetical protein [Paludibacter jiangxiensis]GAT62540.1 hypothetical protein PJIAN_299 [Paludibacter jiangxiensis]
MIVDNKEILHDFYKHFNSRLTSWDFVIKYKQLKSGYNPREETALILPVDNEKTYEQLLSNSYPNLVEGILRNIQVEKSCRDVFLSELDEEILSLFEEFIREASLKSEVVIHNERIMIKSYDMFADLIWSPISQFHSELTASVDYFNKYIEAVGGNKECLFLNANSSTSFSYFIQIWVCESLGIPLNPNSNVLVS